MKSTSNLILKNLLTEVKQCSLCAGNIPAPNPVLRANTSARILVIGQAPGTKVHASGIPWDDASGKRLRQWMGVNAETFYDESRIAIVPMGFCYPGKGKSGDLPPRPECAPAWHEKVLGLMPDIQCTLLIGLYAQNYYCQTSAKTLTERVQDWQAFAPGKFLLPHPSPRNQFWFKRNPWFEHEVVPNLQRTLSSLI